MYEMKSPKSPYKKAKAKAWRWFSRYIRLRDCIRTTGFKDQGKCVTCQGYFPFSELDAGHALAGRNMSILFDEELVNAQCHHCNRSAEYGGLGGNYGVYSLWFIEKYGLKKWEKKVFLSNQGGKMSIMELEELATKYREKYNKLMERRT